MHKRPMADLDFCVPLIPPSCNHYKKPGRYGGYYLTDAAEEFRVAVAAYSKGRQVRHEYYAIEIYLTLGKKQKLDLDNCAKVVLDSLVKCGTIHSDAAVTQLILHKKRDWANPGTSITIWEGKEP